MGKTTEKKLRSAKSNHEQEEERELKPQLIPSSDDEDADEDLSLKIVEKAMLRACNNASGNGVVLDEPNDGAVVNVSSSRDAEKDDIMVKKKKKKKNKKMETETDAVDVARREGNTETSNSMETAPFIEINPVEKPDNVVLRKLLRGPRYFDPPDSSWGACYNCGEGGHMTANCTSAKRKKPCFVCGSLEHNAKQCKKGKDCFICKKGGHRAKDCPQKSTGGSLNVKFCLKCGDSGHDMFSCRNTYSPDDLKDIQCYICKCFGHLCCVNYTGAGAIEVSCYRCGQSGHTGLACTKLRADTTSMWASSSCYKCGEEGHFARECISSAKISKRNWESSNAKWSHAEEDRNNMGVKSAPYDLGKGRKRKKTQYEGVTSSSNSKHRGGWTTEDPGDISSHRKYRSNGWRSPATPTNRTNNASSRYGGGGRKLQFGISGSSGSAKTYQHRFSASRFGNSSSYGIRDYGW